MPRTLPGRPTKWTPQGLSDSIDGSNSFPGAMTQLVNLVPSPTQRGAWVPRPASAVLASFAGFTSPAEGTALLQIGNIIYGMIEETSGTFNGLDVPFAYNTKTAAYLTIANPGGAAALPTSPSNSGDWTPPTMAQVGARIIITHPGYAGGNDPFFGWLDVSGFSQNTVTGATNTSKTITGLSIDVLQAGWQPGMTITDSSSDIPANTVIETIDEGSLDLNTTATLNGTNTLTSVASITGVVPGVNCYAGTLLLGQVISASMTTVVLNQATPTSLSGMSVGINFSGATSVTISNAAIGSHSTTFTVAGGTAAAPLYGSGNTNVTPLPTVPVAVYNFNGRAYYACPGNGLKFSDPLLPCNISFSDQGLNAANGLDFTALVGLPQSQVIGGILQSLIAFQGDSQMQQITGDLTLGTLAMNELGTGTGTLSPNTLCQTTMGVAFLDTDGLRFVTFGGTVTDPVGTNGDGVCVPFLNIVNPTRACAAFNSNVLRISVKNGNAVGQPVQEYWFDMSLKRWSGPHSFPASLIAAYQGTPNHGFALFASGINAKLWTSAVIPKSSDSYTENNVLLNWNYQTVLLPDNDSMAMNKMVLTTLTCAIASAEIINVDVIDENLNTLDQVTLMGNGSAQTVWDDFDWGAAPWAAQAAPLYQHPIAWHLPLIFKQASILVNGYSVLGTVISNINMQIEPLGYLTQASG